ncbi:MAG: DUF4838 domain-containing protein [Armatimonadetes bacterium]|nr:DUF4838 domain-containing protein [Armatimonadota bacterium]
MLRRTLLVGLLVPAAAMAQPLTLVEGGRSAYVIYREADAPPSVHLAAREIQRVVKVATGVELPVTGSPAAQMVSVGDNLASRAAGLATDELPEDAFLLSTRGQALYVLGKDFPDDGSPARGWNSRGTLNAAYDLLERFAGARWLMPGDIGEEIPGLDKLAVPALDEKHVPRFPVRYIADLQDRRPPGDTGPNLAKEWLLRHKMLSTTDGRRLEHGHNWDGLVPQAEWEKHPEWLAKDEGGKPRTYYDKHPAGVKFCTSNRDLVQAFAQGVIRFMDEHPTTRFTPISPSDGGDFCQCPECLRLVTRDPHGRPSYTPVILRFYNDVAEIVAQKHADRPMAGYVYYNYMYPPAEPPKMHANVWLVMAGLNYYGYGLLKPVYRDEFDGVIEGWLRVTPNFAYYGYSNWMRSFNGAPLPAARDLLKQEIPTLARHGAKGIEVVGLGAWGVGAPTNYLYAKQLWDPAIDVDRTYDDWLRLAYGPAYEPLRRLLDLVEQRFVAYKSAESPVYRGEMYEMNYAKAEAIYLPAFTQMESLYVEALGKAQTEKQRARLRAFGDNLIQLHWGMRKSGMVVPDPERSVFYRNDADYGRFVADTEFSLWLYRDHGKRFTDPIWKGEWSG